MNLPPQITSRDQWVTWVYEIDPEHPDKKPRKMPKNPRTGGNAQSNNPATWASYSFALRQVQARKHVGPGYIFAKDDPFTGVDLDGCRNPETGVIAPWALEIIQSLNSYAEVSPSGTGVKIMVAGTVPAAVKTARIEIYAERRFFTVTGQHVEDTPLEVLDGQAALTALYNTLRPAPEAPAPIPPRVIPANDHAARWAENKMTWIEAELRSTPEGNKHNRRLELAKLAGGIVALGLISEEDAASRLYNALPPVSHEQQERKAIADGIKTGKASPLVLPQFPTEQSLILRESAAFCPSCDTPVLRSKYDYPGTTTPGWYCPSCKHPMVWPFEAWQAKEEVREEAPVAPPELSLCSSLPPHAQLPPDAHVGACPWLEDYVAFSRQWSPRGYEGFHWATGLWVLSTVAARRVMLPLGGERFPSLYIALASRTSLFAKSTTAKIGIGLLRAAGLDFFLAADDATPQAFIHALTGRVPATWNALPDGLQRHLEQRIAFAAQRGWWYDEFSQKISGMMKENGHMADFRGLLRKFDDAPARYEYNSIQRVDLVERPYLALLANLTPSDLQPFAKKGAALWSDGFWARFAFVTPPAEEPRAEGQFPEGEQAWPRELTEPLREWHWRLGVPSVEVVEAEEGDKEVFRANVSTREPQRCVLGPGVYDAFYRYNDALIDLVADSQNTDLDGNYARFAEKAMRVAMLAASMQNGGIIEMRHWALGQTMAEQWRQNLHNLVAQLGIRDVAVSREAELESQVLETIARREQATANDLRRYIRGVGLEELARTLDTLERGGLVSVVMTQKGSKRYMVVSANGMVDNVDSRTVDSIEKRLRLPLSPSNGRQKSPPSTNLLSTLSTIPSHDTLKNNNNKGIEASVDISEYSLEAHRLADNRERWRLHHDPTGEIVGDYASEEEALAAIKEHRP